jgi:hypothetical protein
MPPRPRGFGLPLLALVACTHPPGTVAPDPCRDIAPRQAQGEPSLGTLTARGATGGTSGDARGGPLLGQILVAAAPAPRRLTSVTTPLDVATVVSPTVSRPRADQARAQLTRRVESLALGARQAWLQGTGAG